MEADLASKIIKKLEGRKSTENSLYQRVNIARVTWFTTN
jgi:hypothetical protein